MEDIKRNTIVQLHTISKEEFQSYIIWWKAQKRVILNKICISCIVHFCLGRNSFRLGIFFKMSYEFYGIRIFGFFLNIYLFTFFLNIYLNIFLLNVHTFNFSKLILKISYFTWKNESNKEWISSSESLPLSMKGKPRRYF